MGNFCPLTLPLIPALFTPHFLVITEGTDTGGQLVKNVNTLLVTATETHSSYFTRLVQAVQPVQL
jgi:hypothetical protein